MIQNGRNALSDFAIDFVRPGFDAGFSTKRDYDVMVADTI